MAHFRLYRTGPDNRIRSALDVEFASEEEAVELASEIVDVESGAEVWQGTRLVSRVSVQRESMASVSE